MIYSRNINFHDKKGKLISTILEIVKINNHIQLRITTDNFKPSTSTQKSLYRLYKYADRKDYCKVTNTKETQELINYCNELCKNIELEEMLYLTSIEEKSIDDINDDRIIALMNHLGITPQEALDDIKESTYGYNIYEYGSQEYQILTDDEADKEEYEAVESLIEDCYLSELRHINKDHPALDYIDVDKWIEDWLGNRGNNLSSYDGEENEEKVNSETYYIYRKN